MAITTDINLCSNKMCKILSNSFIVDNFRSYLGTLLKYIRVKAMPGAGCWKATNFGDVDFVENCDRQNYLDNSGLAVSIRTGSMCNYSLDIKICDEDIVIETVSLAAWTDMLIKKVFKASVRVIIKCLYQGLGGNVIVGEGAQSETLSFANDVKPSQIIDATGANGFTTDVFFKLLLAITGAVGGIPSEFGTLILLIPQGALISLKQNLMAAGHCCTTTGDLLGMIHADTTYGKVVVVPMMTNRGERWVSPGVDSTKVRGFAFYADAVEMAYSYYSTMGESHGPGIIPIGNGVQESMIHGKLIIDPQERPGGISVSAKMVMGAIRIDPTKIFAIDFLRSKVFI